MEVSAVLVRVYISLYVGLIPPAIIGAYSGWGARVAKFTETLHPRSCGFRECLDTELCRPISLLMKSGSNVHQWPLHWQCLSYKENSCFFLTTWANLRREFSTSSPHLYFSPKCLKCLLLCCFHTGHRKLHTYQRYNMWHLCEEGVLLSNLWIRRECWTGEQGSHQHRNYISLHPWWVRW